MEVNYCIYCKGALKRSEQVVKYKKASYHPTCLIKFLQELKGRECFTEEQAKRYVADALVIEKEQEKAKKTKKLQGNNSRLIKIKMAKAIEKTFDNSDKNLDNLKAYLINTYHLMIVDGRIMKCLVSIIDGTYGKQKGIEMSSGISPIELLDMFEIYQNDLIKARIWKEKKGQGFESATNEIVYDLAILVSKYNEYLKTHKKDKQFKEYTQKNNISQVDVFCHIGNMQNTEKISGRDLTNICDDINGD